MLYTEYIKLNSLAIHIVGNKLNQDPIRFSKSCVNLNSEIEKHLLHYFISHFKIEEQYRFSHDTELNLNEAYSYVSKVFDNPNSLFEQSKNLAKHLYNQSNHPKIKEGEFYVAYINNCILNGETLDAIGLFKSENKNIFLEVESIAEGYEIESKKGIDINKLDKGCIIFNTKKENGYILSIIDNTNRSSEAQYWKDNFLRIQPLRNEFHQTNEFLGIAKQYVTKQITQDFEVSKSEQIDLLNRSVEYFKTNDKFEKEDFEKSVFQDDKLIDAFNIFDRSFRQEYEIEPADSFDISKHAVKKQSRSFKRVLKLDKNFHIYIHGDKDLIEQGVDKDGRKFYKIYYNEEN